MNLTEVGREGKGEKTNTDIDRKLGSGGLSCLMEKTQYPRSLACLLYRVNREVGLLNTRRQGLWYRVRSRRQT